ncbi:Uncharacterised protein [Cedecea neteri]|uniref:Uncharacterized protein n=1 Tax=Cedecea neteri TaxID=158822 RepID=A0A2X3J8Z4_9ENTR|nr:Uncharacterised protein [Cedecea neteri]
MVKSLVVVVIFFARIPCKNQGEKTLPPKPHAGQGHMSGNSQTNSKCHYLCKVVSIEKLQGWGESVILAIKEANYKNILHSGLMNTECKIF